MFKDFGFRVRGAGFATVNSLGFRVQGPGFRVYRAGFRVRGSGFRIQGSGFRVQGSGFGVSGSGFRVSCSGFGIQCLPSRVQGSGLRVYQGHCVTPSTSRHLTPYRPTIPTILRPGTGPRTAPQSPQSYSCPPTRQQPKTFSGNPRPDLALTVLYTVHSLDSGLGFRVRG